MFSLDVDSDNELLIYSIVMEDDTASTSACEVHTDEVKANDSPTIDMLSPPDEDLSDVAKPYPGFHAQVLQLLSDLSTTSVAGII